MRSALGLLSIALAACGAGPSSPFDAAPDDANRVCGVPLQLEIALADAGDCAGPPTVILVTDASGAVASVSASVPRGVTVPSIACASAPPPPSCAWALALHCEGPNGEALALAGTLTGADHAWTSDAITLTLTGLPPARLTCSTTSSATTR